MSNKQSDSGKNKFSLLAILLHPGVKILGGVFSIIAALFFGKTQISKHKKKKASQSEARIAASLLLVKQQEIRNRLAAFQVWLKKQDTASIDTQEIQNYHTELKKLYSEWISHERMEEVLNTVQYDPKIGMSISNGLFELRSLNVLIEAILKNNLFDSAEGQRQLAIINEHLSRAIELFNYINKDVANLPENKQVDTLKDKPQ